MDHPTPATTPFPPLAPLADAELDTLADGGLVVRDAVLPLTTVAALRDELEAAWAAEALSPAGMGTTKVHATALRGDHTAWASDLAVLPVVSQLTTWSTQAAATLRQDTRQALRSLDIQLARFAPGTRYARHVDALSAASARRLTAILYLNPTWHPDDGGALRAHLPSGPTDIAPRAGRWVLFRADAVPHEVLPTRVARWAATSWLRADDGAAWAVPGA